MKLFQHFRFFLLLLSALLSTMANAQNKSVFITPRISFQSDFQKADFKDNRFPFEFKEHTATELNWGIDVLAEKEIFNKWSIYFGVGYFRNRFNFERAYDHQLLNSGRDSLPIGTSTKNYTFHLLRFPIGVSYRLLEKNKYDFKLSIENVINFSFQQVYKGRKAFPGATNKYSAFRYYGNTILLSGGVSKRLSPSSLLQIGPCVRLLNIYKRNDIFLYENKLKPYIRALDGIGLSLKYATNFKQ
ncbi:MAG: outer membrane beta-barrel protein [Ginsengibacter sp.]